MLQLFYCGQSVRSVHEKPFFMGVEESHDQTLQQSLLLNAVSQFLLPRGVDGADASLGDNDLADFDVDGSSWTHLSTCLPFTGLLCPPLHPSRPLSQRQHTPTEGFEVSGGGSSKLHKDSPGQLLWPDSRRR